MCLSQREYDVSPKQLSNIVWDDEHHLLRIARTTVTFTKMEYRMLSSLRDGRPVAYTILARLMYNRELDGKVRTMMDKLIDRIRGKLRGTGVYVYCVLGYGYFLLPEILSTKDL
jgi:DNA-binding response OmpR family regulator